MEGLFVRNVPGDSNGENFLLKFARPVYYETKSTFSLSWHDFVGKYLFVYHKKVHVSAFVPKPLSGPRLIKV